MNAKATVSAGHFAKTTVERRSHATAAVGISVRDKSEVAVFRPTVGSTHPAIGRAHRLSAELGAPAKTLTQTGDSERCESSIGHGPTNLPEYRGRVELG